MTRRLAGRLAIAAVLLGACSAGPAPSASPSPRVVGGASQAPAASSPALPTAPVTPGPVPSTTGGPVPSTTPAPTPASPFRLSSSAFREGGAIPARYTCSGADVSPALAWDGVPADTVSLVLLVDDPDAHDFAHWIVYAMAADATHLDEGAGTVASSRLRQGTNDFGRVGWGGPCPPSGTHRYRFTLSALAQQLGVDGNPSARTVRAALAKAQVLGRATLTGTYARGG